MSTPLRIHGPAVIIFNGVTYYFKTGLKCAIRRKKIDIAVDAFGRIGEVARDCIAEFTGTPAGSIRAADLAGQMPYSPAMIGQSIFGGSDAPLVIQTFAGEQVRWARGAISKYAPMILSATEGTLYKGEMTFSCLMASDFNETSTAAWNSDTQQAFADTTFDPGKVRTAAYTASWGSTTPYNSMIAQDGFHLIPEIATEPIWVDNHGVIDIVLKSMNGSVKFKPASLTEAQVTSLAGLQGAGALLPGAVIGDGATDLVISSNRLVATLKSASVADCELLYATGKLRPGEVAWSAPLSFTNGTPNAIFTFSVPS